MKYPGEYIAREPCAVCSGSYTFMSHTYNEKVENINFHLRPNAKDGIIKVIMILIFLPLLLYLLHF